MTAVDPSRFQAASLDALDEPVRRYFNHALRPGAIPSAAVRLEMTGRIKVGAWLPFTAVWEGDGRSFTWRAVAGRVLRVVDRFADGAGSMDVRLLGRLPLVHADDEDTARSAAGRAAVEAMWTPAGMLPERGVGWRADDDATIIATWEIPPERPEVRLSIGADGAVRSCWAMRWNAGAHAYAPCGARVHEDRRFGDLTIPSDVTAGWWFGTPRWKPFFEAEVLAATSAGRCGP